MRFDPLFSPFVNTTFRLLTRIQSSRPSLVVSHLLLGDITISLRTSTAESSKTRSKKAWFLPHGTPYLGLVHGTERGVSEMGNSQAAEAATVVVQLPDGKLATFYWSVSAKDVMAAFPCHYVAAIITIATVAGLSPEDRRTATFTAAAKNKPVRYVKLLRPDETLIIGHFYRLVSFEEVLKVFGSRERVRLSKLLGKGEGRRREAGAPAGERPTSPSLMVDQEKQEPNKLGIGGESSIMAGGRMPKNGQWRPTLQIVAEAGN